MSSPARKELDELGRRLLAKARSSVPKTLRGQKLAGARPIGLAERLAGVPREPARYETAEPSGPGANLLTLLQAAPQAPAGPELVLASRRRVTPAPPPAVEAAAPIPAALRAQLEPMVGEGLEDVRLHSGAAAQAMAARFGAAAFAHGRDVFFGRDRLRLDTPEGRALLAHEAVHANQQVRDAAAGPSAEGEAAAEAAERRVLARERPGRGAVLAVDHLVRNYAAEGASLTARDVARLDGLSARALAVCERLLADSSASSANVDLSTLHVDVTLDLDGASDQQLAEIWGRALAREIERHAPPGALRRN